MGWAPKEIEVLTRSVTGWNVCQLLVGPGMFEGSCRCRWRPSLSPSSLHLRGAGPAWCDLWTSLIPKHWAFSSKEKKEGDEDRNAFQRTQKLPAALIWVWDLCLQPVAPSFRSFLHSLRDSFPFAASVIGWKRKRKPFRQLLFFQVCLQRKDWTGHLLGAREGRGRRRKKENGLKLRRH